GLYLDGMGRTTNGATAGQYGNSGSPNQHWAVEQFDGDFYRIRNRTTSLYLDGMGRTTNGADVGQWANTTNANAQWGFGSPAAARMATTLAAQPATADASPTLYPNPVRDVLHINLPQSSRDTRARILNMTGQVVRSLPLTGADGALDVHDLPSGLYLVELATATQTTRLRFVKE
ncbi:RICIN domain-containing protein, partial [Hymenobacter sp. AT01-02]|uniref:RICIN domain-containing protein n=1 Tax=Hymenobacter sp. AT01-02 TaxID=1571877 RepID=UPI000A533922